jgi:purine-binding chemotaxis protein CheW
MSTAVTADAPTKGGKFLTFYLADEEYGVEILKVQEIIGMQPITRVPRTPAFVRGVINLRGKVIPIMDLRERFHMDAIDEAGELDEATAALRCIIVVHVAGAQDRVVPMGIVVDRVSEVVAIAPDDVEDTPSFGAAVKTEYLLGLGKTRGGEAQGGGRVKLLLDIDRVLASDELAAVTQLDA